MQSLKRPCPQYAASPRTQVNPSSGEPSQSSSSPLHVSAGGTQDPDQLHATQERVPVEPQVVVHDCIPVPSQSSSWVTAPSPQTAGQSSGQVVAVSPPVHSLSPHATGQSAGQVAEDSGWVQAPSPHSGGQSAAQDTADSSCVQ
jgi:hypothetical protein